MPKGFLCLDCGYIREEFPSLMAMVKRAEWEIYLDDVGHEEGGHALEMLLARDVVEIEKETKKGKRIVDLRPGIYDVKYSKEGHGVKFFVTLATGSSGNVSPRNFIKAMGFDQRYALYHRVDLYYEYKGDYLPMNHSTKVV
jgi:radical SAM-linked protein